MLSAFHPMSARIATIWNEMDQKVETFGRHLRAWRQRRRLSQLELALRSDVSARHLGFVETGRASPGRALVLRLADELDVPLRERNVWLVAAGMAPIFGETSINDASFEGIRAAVELTLEAHKPFPAFAIDRHWNVVLSNAAVPELYEGISAELLEIPINVMHLTFRPGGLGQRILNFDEWAQHLLHRLRREVYLTGDPGLRDLLEEAETLYRPSKRPRGGHAVAHSLAIPLRIQTKLGPLSFFSTVTVFGTPVDVTVSEIALEMLYPADEETIHAVRGSSS
ncbi:helix-turn-helix domain-containing protein [Ochrobactrum sp. BTU1]|uniref:helix-turn-helix domain-containing protein n=1 Tax=Ochrobactrum sp. BTU1 TaxID=2840456 RepID=UPI001C042659|nr:helix-turn-helix transcriptional regulator [Ochrobactrum sp. BTU1]